MKITFQKELPNEGKLYLHLTPEDYQEAWEKNIRKYKPHVERKGFRKGKLSLDLVKQKHGLELLRETVTKIGKEHLFDYIDAQKIRLLGTPIQDLKGLKNLSWKDPQELTLTYHLGIEPHFEVKLDKSVKVTQYHVKRMEGEDLKELIEGFRHAYSLFHDQEKVSEDHLIQGKITTENGQDEAPYHIFLEKKEAKILYPLLLGAEKESKIPLDAAARDLFDQYRPLPPSLKEQESIVFYIDKILERELPQLNQDFFTKVLGVEVQNEEEFREKLADIMLDKDQQKATRYLHFLLRETLLLHTEIPLPLHMIKTWVYAETKGETIPPEAEEGNCTAYADTLKWKLICDKLIKEYNLQATPEEIKEVALEQVKESPELANPSRSLEEYTESVLKRNNSKLYNTLKQFISRKKVLEIIMQKITLEPQYISSKQLHALLDKRNLLGM